MSIAERIIELKELSWSFNSDPPKLHFGVTEYKSFVEVDPCPCFTHDASLVQTTLEFCEAVFPLPTPPTIYLSSFEGMGRTNGQTNSETDYKRKTEHGEYVIVPTIILFGKRTPIHPAMTRYLVAHEYGHAVEKAIAQKLYKGSESSDLLLKDYSLIRKIHYTREYGPGKWAAAPGEIFANDFRVLLPGIEREFWAHDVPMPQENPGIVKWWQDARNLKLSSES